MPELYIALAKGLADDCKALDILRRSKIVDGIETTEINDTNQKIRDAGLKVSSHTPGREHTMNLSAEQYSAFFDTPVGQQIFETIRSSEAKTIGFHCGYSAGKVYKMKSFPNVPALGTIFHQKKKLLERMSKNIIALEKRINQQQPEEKRKILVLETLDFSREQPIDWSKQTKEAILKQHEIEEVVSKFGINAGLLHVTEPTYFKALFEYLEGKTVNQIGFLFDVSHTLISADTKIHTGQFQGCVRDYFEIMLEQTSSRTNQIHVAVPSGNSNTGYTDSHNILQKNDPNSEKIIRLTRQVVGSSRPNIETITLEMVTNLPPKQHAQLMIDQATYFIERIADKL